MNQIAHTTELTKISRALACGAFLALAAFSKTALAGPVLASVAAGVQSPDPVNPGSNASYVVTVTRTGTGNLDAYLSVSGLPTGVTASFSPNPVHFSGSPSTGTSTMVLSTSSTTPQGSLPLTILADDGGSHNIVSNTCTLDVLTPRAGVTQSGNGSMVITLKAPPGSNCCIQATTSLVAPVWVTLCVTNSGANNLLVYVDQDAPNYPCRFYRLTVP